VAQKRKKTQETIAAGPLRELDRVIAGGSDDHQIGQHRVGVAAVDRRQGAADAAGD
jgi:hypothetical protein